MGEATGAAFAAAATAIASWETAAGSGLSLLSEVGSGADCLQAASAASKAMASRGRDNG